MGGGRYDPGVTEPALPCLALDRLEAVVFDTDGVLTDTASVHAAAWKRLFDEYLQLRATAMAMRWPCRSRSDQAHGGQHPS
jgi:beta-phosphoglucomutase-like phosphatase (HAD superfamily)